MVSRIFDAPRELVWQAWTNPRHVARWWGPNGFSTTTEKMDLRPGGTWKHVMHGPDGTNYPNESVFSEVSPMERIVYTHGGHKEGGTSVSFVATWTFESVGPERTRLTIRMAFPSAAERDRVVREFGAGEGANQTLGRLAGYLDELGKHGEASQSEREVVIVRTFDASREIVWRAWVDADYLRRWWGPEAFTNPVCEADARVGGKWGIQMRAPDGTTYPCGGTYLEVVPMERLVFTNDAVDKDGSVILKGLTTVTLEAEGSRTRMTLRSRAEAKVPYAKAYLSGMEAGWTQSIDRLEAELRG
jgi:uncharacterized protein YndB with AHSA1/START domain